MTAKVLRTRRGDVRLPAYFPVTTFGERYPLDALIRPYLPRLASGVMVSYHYARGMTEVPRVPVLLDSGGFASLFEGARVVEERGLGVLEVSRGGVVERTHPRDVLDLQERVADVAFTLDFPVPPGMEAGEARRRQKLTIANSHWALANRRRRDLPLFACVQAWDEESARECARAYAGAGFDGIALGGMVPRASDRELVRGMVGAVRGVVGELPLHVFGLGKPELVEEVWRAGADSVDSSAYVKLAAEGRLWGRPGVRVRAPSPTDRLHLALCNLAAACGRALPLSLAGLVFTTAALEGEEA
jgi:tRNA-guanine family transglycosylase